jgi:hypothetical protein
VTLYDAKSALESAMGRSLRSRLSRGGADVPEGELEKLEKHARSSWLPLVDGFGLDEKQTAEIMSLALHCQIEMHRGRIDEAKVKALDELIYADLRAHGLNNKQIGAKLEALNARLFREKPAAHAALDRGYPLGHYPQVIRPLLAWHNRHTADELSRERSIAAKMAPAGGTTLKPSAEGVGVTALRNLGRDPLSEADA